MESKSATFELFSPRPPQRWTANFFRDTMIGVQSLKICGSVFDILTAVGLLISGYKVARAVFSAAPITKNFYILLIGSLALFKLGKYFHNLIPQHLGDLIPAKNEEGFVINETPLQTSKSVILDLVKEGFAFLRPEPTNADSWSAAWEYIQVANFAYCWFNPKYTGNLISPIYDPATESPRFLVDSKVFSKDENEAIELVRAANLRGVVLEFTLLQA